MLGKYVRVRVTGFENGVNYGVIDYVTAKSREQLPAYIMGIDHAVRNFDGRVIASFVKDHKVNFVVSPKSKRFIINDIYSALAPFGVSKNELACLYERSCGAIVFREIDGERRFLIIKNKRSAHWSFPKGHVEQDETPEQTAFREVLEETGVHIKIIPGFRLVSEYTIQNRVEKSVDIYLATTDDTRTVMQEEEIESYDWLSYESAMKRLRFENDKNIFEQAHLYLIDNKI